jgi:phenylacetate-CoA ligase
MSLAPFFIRRAIAPLWAYHERSPYLRICRDLKAHERISLDERLSRQWVQLVEMVGHAWAKCPYYRRRFGETGFEPAMLKGWEDLKRLPILTKDDIRENTASMIAQGEKKEDLIPRKTSGSTGVSLNFYVKDSEFQFKRGVTLYRDEWTGWKLGDWRAMVWGNPAYLENWRSRIRNRFLERMFSLDTLKMDKEMMRNFSEEVISKKPSLLFGHAHSLYLFADFWKKQGYPLSPFKGILSTAMVLHDHERALCEEVFQTKVFNRYGCEEVSLIASECERHEGLHINTDNLIVEILKDGREAEPGEEGRLIITDLSNRVMPFIRYQVGDLAVPSGKRCSCGRTYPLLERLAGRVADYLLTPEGEWVSGISLTENFATLIPGLKQIQIIQDHRERIVLRMVKGEKFGEASLEEIKRLVKKRFGPRMEYALEFVERLSPEPSGKYRFSICNLHE